MPEVVSPARTPTAGSAPRGVRRLLVDRTFGPFFFGNLFSNFGQWFQNLAAAWVVFELTGSSLWVGAVAMAQFGPTLLLAPLAGALGDRIDRRRALFAGQLVAFVSATLLALWVTIAGIDGLPGPWPVLGATLGMGLGYALSIPTMQAMVPDLVPPADLDEAIALNATTFNLARAVGPAVAGVALATLGPAFAFGVNAVTYMPLLAALLVIRPQQSSVPPSGGHLLSAGLRHVISDRPSALLLAGVAAAGFTSDPVNTLTPGLSDLLGGGEALVGALVAAFGVGAALTTLIAGRLRRRYGQPALAAIGLAVLGGGIAGLAAAGSPAVAVAALLVAGSGFLLAITGLTTLLQRRVPDDLRSRVMALWGVAFLGSRPLAAAIDGALADAAGVRAGVLGASLFAITAAVALWSGRARLSPPST